MDPHPPHVDAVLRAVAGLQKDGTYPYLQAAEAVRGARVRIRGRWLTTFATCSYLGLLDHPRPRAAARRAISSFGTGTHGVRLLGGSVAPHDDLEARLARFAGRDAALVYSSGYVANVATLQALVGRHDAVLWDAHDHASIVDGCRLSGAASWRFDHNDPASLAEGLRATRSAHSRLVVVDAVYSMDGDVAPLPQLVELCRTHDARLMVDEAHSVGVLGAHGRGIEEHFGLEGVIDVKMGTLSKAIPSVGGYVAADAATITFLKHAARGFVFSAALPPPCVAAAAAALQILDQEGVRRRARLERNAQRFREGLQRMGYDTGRSTTPIVPVLVGADEKAFRLSAELLRRGVLALPVVSPAVARGAARVRASVTAAHRTHEIDGALAAFEEAGRCLGLLPRTLPTDRLRSPAPRRAVRPA